MRRIWILCVLFSAMTAAAAVAAVSAPSRGSGWRNAAQLARAPKHKPAPAQYPLLVGNRRVEPNSDSTPGGTAESFPFHAATRGSARTLRIYVDAHSRARTLLVGLYGDRHGRPGTLLASGAKASPARGRWNSVTLRTRSVHFKARLIRAGRVYWIAVMGKRGRFSFRDGSGGCRSATTRQSSLSVMPGSWKMGRVWSTCRISAYVAGKVLHVRATTPVLAPAQPAPPTPPSGGGAGGGGTAGGPWSVPCGLTHDAGTGPSSCWATHTGVQGSTGVTEAQIEANPGAYGFTKHVGDLTIRQPNTVIDHQWIVGCISIADGANNTVIKNTLLTPDGNACTGDNAGGSAINTGQGPNIAKNTLIEDVTIDGGNPGYGSHNAAITVDAGEVLRVNIFGFAQGFISDTNTAQYPALFRDDYGHGYIGCSHDDGTWFNSSSYVTFQHSYIQMGDPGGNDCTTAALAGGSDYGPQNHVVFDSNYGEGNDGEDTHAGCGSTYSAYTNNALSTNNKDYGSGFEAGNTGNTWSGNYSVNDAGGTPGTIRAPVGGC